MDFKPMIEATEAKMDGLKRKQKKKMPVATAATKDMKILADDQHRLQTNYEARMRKLEAEREKTGENENTRKGASANKLEEEKIHKEKRSSWRKASKQHRNK